MADLQQIINSSLSLRIVSTLARHLPSRWGYRIGDFVAGQLARRRDSKLVQAMRLNQWVATGESVAAERLDELVCEVFHYSAHFLFDLYHYGEHLQAARSCIL